MKIEYIMLNQPVDPKSLLFAQAVVADPCDLDLEQVICAIRDLTADTPVPVFVKGKITSLGEVQDLLQAGAKRVILDPSQEELIREVERICGKGRAITDVSQVEERAAAFSWSDMKLNSDGMVPVVVQDYKTNQVLMVAYMNEESFEATIRTGHMVYYSRSRQELWEKGLTSGHFQFVKSLYLDCDNDTILAKVAQIGAACHTGSYSCFFQTLLPAEYPEDEY